MKKYWIYIFLLLILANILLVIAIFRHDDNLHLVFCDVGQGDGILIYKKNIQILIDGGPDRSILSCLGKHISIFDRTVEYIFLTNSDFDHYGGLVDVFKRYKVLGYGTSGVGRDEAGFKELQGLVEKESESRDLVLGNVVRVGEVSLNLLWPAVTKVSAGEPASGTSINEQSLVLELEYGNFNVLLTGDISPPSTDVVAEFILRQKERGLKSANTTVLKVPHHGSKNGLTAKMVEASQPQLAVISAGKNNRYGHPHQEIIGLLEDWKVRTLRTDQEGAVEIVTDGKKWWVVPVRHTLNFQFK